MDKTRIRQLIGFYENELTNNILFFWDEKCLDRQNGGYFNCFDNRGERLMGRDKYTWSQGRFVWVWSRLADMDGIFTNAQREDFLERARLGRDFLLKHALLGPDDWRCAYLLNEFGAPQRVEGEGDRLDLSIWADEFVILGLARYARSAQDAEAFAFAKNLYLSVGDRILRDDYLSQPYPLPREYRSHGMPMGLIYLTNEMIAAARMHEPGWIGELTQILKGHLDDVLDHFVDEHDVLRETIRREGNAQLPSLLGQHVNPGHVLEDAWFMLDAADTLDAPEYLPRIAAVARKALELGWDEELGGLLHFCGVNGGRPDAPPEPDQDLPMTKLVQGSWDDKLWWIHSESLYTTLLLYARTGDHAFLDWHDRVFDYTFEKHANLNREVREWIQILTREGRPQDKVVALPVKDPYHITRNLIQIIELLGGMLHASSE